MLKKRFTSLFLVLSMVLGLSAPAFAVEAENEAPDTESEYSIQVSLADTYTLTDESDSLIGKPFSVNQYKNGELDEVVYGVVGGETLTEVTYENGTEASRKTHYVSDYIQLVESSDYNEQVPCSPFAASRGSRVATIVYNPSPTTGLTHQMQLYHSTEFIAYDTYDINAAAGTAISVIIGALVGAWSPHWLQVASYAEKIVVGIATNLGVSIVSNKIVKAIFGTVGVDHTIHYYSAYNESAGRYSSYYQGHYRVVKETTSNRYNEVFTEGFLPSTWRNNHTLASMLWNEFYSDFFPGVKQYKN